MDVTGILRAPAEQVYADELARLIAVDKHPRPAGWQLSPRAVRTFILGDEEIGVRKKFYGDDALVDRCVVTLMSNRGLLLVGEPGTAKSMLSELLAAAIGGSSTCTVQGTSGTTEDQITYSWNYALLLAEGRRNGRWSEGRCTRRSSRDWSAGSRKSPGCSRRFRTC